MPSLNNVSRVGRRCVGCGACEGVCPTRCIRVKEVGRIGLSPFVENVNCINCGLCVELCPVTDIEKREDLDLKTRVAYHAYSKDTSLYRAGSSGGIVSSVLVHLFREGRIDAAAVAFYNERLDLYGGFITSAEEVINHSGSYYHTCKQLLNIGRVHNYKSVAFVGLPCHIVSLNRYIARFGLKNVYARISLFCTIGRLKRGIEDYIRYEHKLDVRNEVVQSYRSRFGEQRPGEIVVSLTNSKEVRFEYEKLLNFVDYFYTPRGCYFCKHLFGTEADISVGDDWFIDTKRKIGIAVAHTEVGRRVLEENELLELKSIADPEVYLPRTQPLGFALKHSGLSGLHLMFFEALRAIGHLNRFQITRRVPMVLRSVLLRSIRRRTPE